MKAVSAEWVLNQLAGGKYPEQGQAYDYMKKCMETVESLIPSMQFIARTVYFKNGKAIGAGFTSAQFEADKAEVIRLPTDHYDFIGPIKVFGKTKEEIEKEAKTYE